MRIIGGQFRGKKLHAPPQIGANKQITRPTSDRTRETLFNLLSHNRSLSETGFNLQGATVADLCAGTGALGLEAYSRGANQIIFLEQSKKLCNGALRDNIDLLGISDGTAKLLCGDYRQVKAPVAADLILIDPPYADIQPTIIVNTVIQQGWVKQDSIIMVQTAPTFKKFEESLQYALILAYQTSDAYLWFFKLK